MTEQCVLVQTGEPAVAVLARTDPNEQEDVTVLPGLDALPHLRAEK